MKYPFKSNWIRYSKIDGTDMYDVHDCIMNTNSVVMGDHIRFIEKLNGNIAPKELLPNCTKREVARYLIWLEAEGLIRTSMTVISSFPTYMRTVLIVKDNLKYQKIAYYINLVLMVLFLPCLLIGLSLVGRHINDMSVFDHLGSYYLLGYILGLLMGIIFHEIGHATAATAYGGTVLEFGIMLDGFLAAYTSMNNNIVKTRTRKIQISLAGIEVNFLITGISLIQMVLMNDSSGICFGIALANVTLGLINILFIDGVDGMHVMELIIGDDNILDSSRKAIVNAIKCKESKYDETDRIKVAAAGIFSLTRLIYPALILFNVVVFML